MSDEMSLLRKEITVPWNETTLPTLISNYKLTNIFNAEEFGLFYQCLAAKTSHLPDYIEDQDDDVIKDLYFSPPPMRLSKSDAEEALAKLQDLSLFISYGNKIRSLTLKIETFLNKEQTERTLL